MKTLIKSTVSLVIFFASIAFGGATSSYDLQKNFNVSKGGKLVVEVSGGDIQVRTWDKAQVQMIGRNVGDEADQVETEQTGNTIYVKFKVHGGWWPSNRDLRFEFYVPNNFNLNLSTSGGDVTLDGSLTGDVEFSTSGGDLKIDELNGTAEGRTSGGDIMVHDVEKSSEFSTSGGDIQVDRAGNDLDIETSGGEITVGTVGKDLHAVTAGGDIDIRKVGGKLTASTSSGDITVGSVGGSIDVSTSGGDISLTSGSGRISANTSGGDVSISNVVGSVEVSSSGGTVKVGLTPKGDEESDVESSGGDVYLFIPSDAKATVHMEASGGDDNEIFSDFPVTLREKSNFYGERRGEIMLNGGGQEIHLHTSSGNIYVKKLSSWSR